MLNKYDTMPEELYQILAARFPQGERLVGKYFLSPARNEHIRIQDFLVIVEAEDKTIRVTLLDIIKKYANRYNKDWIIVFVNQEKKCEYFSSNKRTNEVLNLLLSIENLSSDFDFTNNIFYNSTMLLNIEEQTITYLSDKKELIKITNHEDIQLFNKLQQEIIDEISSLKEKILFVVKKYDEKAYYYRFDVLNLFAQNFIFKIQKTNNGWKVFFYKSYNNDYIFLSDSLVSLQDDLLELADKHAREERFVALFRDDYEF